MTVTFIQPGVCVSQAFMSVELVKWVPALSQAPSLGDWSQPPVGSGSRAFLLPDLSPVFL